MTSGLFLLSTVCVLGRIMTADFIYVIAFKTTEVSTCCELNHQFGSQDTTNGSITRTFATAHCRFFTINMKVVNLMIIKHKKKQLQLIVLKLKIK